MIGIKFKNNIVERKMNNQSHPPSTNFYAPPKEEKARDHSSDNGSEYGSEEEQEHSQNDCMVVSLNSSRNSNYRNSKQLRRKGNWIQSAVRPSQLNEAILTNHCVLTQS